MVELDTIRKGSSKLYPFCSPALTYYSKGRYALVDALRLINRQNSGRLLLPSFICRSVTDTLTRAGYAYAYYPVTRLATARLNALESRLDETVSSVLFVNYFGFPQPVSPLLSICRNRGIAVIEDNAHGLLGEDEEGRPLGSRGDIGIFSFPKTIYLPDGGGMIVNDPDRFDGSGSDCSIDPAPGFHAAFLLKRQALKTIGVMGIDPKVIVRLKRGHRKPEGEGVDGNRQISWVSKYLLGKIARQAVIDCRLGSYRRVVEICREEGLEPLFDTVSDRICPYLVPIVAPEGERRNAAAQRLREGGWRVSHWPDLPSDLEQVTCEEARWLRDNIMAVYLRPAVF